MSKLENNILAKDDVRSINKIIESFVSDPLYELEVGFRDIDYPTYIRVVRDFVENTDKKNIESTVSLDVAIILESGETFRVSFWGQELIDKFMEKVTGKNNRVSYQDVLRYVSNIKPDVPNMEFMLKERGSAEILNLTDINSRIRLTKEIPIKSNDQKPTINGNEKMLFRLKNRNTFNVNKNIKIDMTEVQQSNVIWKLYGSQTRYEIEMEVLNRKISSDTFIKELISNLEIIQNSPIPIGRTESESVIAEYKSILNLKYLIHLEKRNTISMEMQHLVNYVPNKYGINDKADGERYHLLSLKQGVYLISNNLVVTKLNIEISESKYQNMILDGELISNESGKMFLIFDVLYANEIDYRHNIKHNLVNRINAVNNIISKCFDSLIPFNDFSDKNTDMELNDIEKYYTKELQKYWKEFKKRLSSLSEKKEIFITRKLYFIPYGIDISEVFLYANLVWKLYVYEGIIPYTLDGIIYTPLDSPYMIKVPSKDYDAVPLEYKWKDPKQNSIDFYIRFEKNTNGEDVLFYDEPTKKGAGRTYKIANLFVGESDGNYERPIPFKINGVDQKAYVYAPDGVARDSNKVPIDDNTVLEFVYDNVQVNSKIQQADNAYKWIPIKTRYDKTESVIKYHKSYGNPEFIANRIWKSIINPVTEDVINLLANHKTYQKEMDRLKETLKNKEEFVYYADKVKVISGEEKGEHMRAFHNWIKSNMILSYCKNKVSVWDSGCGLGGDITKFIRAEIGEYVGTDVDNNGLHVINDCASCRYKSLKKNNPNIPPMTFINADSKGILDVKSQTKIFPNMEDTNKELINKFLSGKKKYNVVNCQFSIHYYLSDEISWNNFCTNINNHTAPNAYFLITTFDGKVIKDKLDKKKKLTISYTNNSGNKSVFSEIIKLYDDADTNPIGQGINVYNSTIFAKGKYVKEYLVDPDFLIESLSKKCGMELVETDSFFNLFNLYKNYFTSGGVDQMNKQQKSVVKYYKLLDPNMKNKFSTEEIEIAKACFAFSSLNRYYVFKKQVNIDFDEPARLVGINNEIKLNKMITPHFESKNMIIDIDYKHPRINTLYKKMKEGILGVTKDDTPNVYLIRHSITKDIINKEEYYDNLVEVVQLKEGSGSNFIMIYKSPDKYFYPIYQRIHEDKKYLFSDKKIINDINVLTKIFDKEKRSK
jgi:hypothetical protein